MLYGCACLGRHGFITGMAFSIVSNWPTIRLELISEYIVFKTCCQYLPTAADATCGRFGTVLLVSRESMRFHCAFKAKKQAAATGARGFNAGLVTQSNNGRAEIRKCENMTVGKPKV